MDKYQQKLRWMIVAGSTAGFIGGWALLAHAGKPVANTDVYVDDGSTAPTAPVTVQTAPLGQLPPIDFNAIEAGRGTANSAPPVQIMPDTTTTQSQAAPVFRPRFRTRTS